MAFDFLPKSNMGKNFSMIPWQRCGLSQVGSMKPPVTLTPAFAASMRSEFG
jgi:hypothetical protein